MTTPAAQKCVAYGPTNYLDTRARTGGVPKIPHKLVVGEIKPHNADGIRDGIKQLRDSGRPGMRLLLTYRPVRGRGPSTYEVLMPHPQQLLDVIRNPPKETKLLLARLTTWYKIGGDIEESCAVSQIPYRACPSLFGAQMEGRVRAQYRSFMRGHLGFPISLPDKSPWAKGPDVLHEELADFLSELAVQLQAA